MRFLIVLITLASIQALAEPQINDKWTCTQTATLRSGSVWHACGVGEANMEREARQHSLDSALDEFKALCAIDSNCKDHSTQVEPKRTTCMVNMTGPQWWWKCYRMVDITVGN